MKLGIFTDSHYCNAESMDNTRRPSLSLDKIKDAMKAFADAKVDACFCMGDLTDHAPGNTKEDVVKCFKECVEMIKSYNIPFNFIPGNHDYIIMNHDEVEEMLGQKMPPKVLEFMNFNFIMLDANYRSSGFRFDQVEDHCWNDSNLPQWQVDFFEKALNESEKDCIVFVHENLDPNIAPSHLVKNHEKIRELIKNSGKVKAVIQGHYHKGAENMVDGIPYITLSAMCEGTENSYKIIEF